MEHNAHITSAEELYPRGQTSRLQKYVGFILLFLILFGLYLGREFLTPVLLSFLISLTLTPVVRAFAKFGLPAWISATILVTTTSAFIVFLGYVTSGPVTTLIADAPHITERLKEKAHSIQFTMEKAIQATEQIDSATAAADAGNVQRVVVAQPGIMTRAAGNALSIVTTLAITFVLSLFLLSSGTLFYEKIVQSVPRLSDKKKLLRVVYSVEREISRYLFTVTVINTCLGLAVGSGLWFMGMPDALVWGVAAGVLNFLPYIGAMMTLACVAVMSLASFDSLAYGLLPPAFVLFCNIIEGQFITPTMVGRRLELNTVAVFISISFWSWIWGFIGALLAVPLLVVIKVICDHFESLQPVGNFLSAQRMTISDEE